MIHVITATFHADGSTSLRVAAVPPDLDDDDGLARLLDAEPIFDVPDLEDPSR